MQKIIFLLLLSQIVKAIEPKRPSKMYLTPIHKVGVWLLLYMFLAVWLIIRWTRQTCLYVRHRPADFGRPKWFNEYATITMVQPYDLLIITNTFISTCIPAIIHDQFSYFETGWLFGLFTRSIKSTMNHILVGWGVPLFHVRREHWQRFE